MNREERKLAAIMARIQRMEAKGGDSSGPTSPIKREASGAGDDDDPAAGGASMPPSTPGAGAEPLTPNPSRPSSRPRQKSTGPQKRRNSSTSLSGGGAAKPPPPSSKAARTASLSRTASPVPARPSVSLSTPATAAPPPAAKRPSSSVTTGNGPRKTFCPASAAPASRHRDAVSTFVEKVCWVGRRVPHFV